MRTTLTLDDDLAAMLAREAKLKGLSYKEIVNSVLRKGLSIEGVTSPQTKVVTRPHSFGFKPGVDLDKLNQLVDELEAESFAAKLERRS